MNNPFMTEAPPAPEPNPFFEAAKQQPAPQMPARTKDESGRPTRPDGSYYSSDPKQRMIELRADGKVGPQFGHLSSGKNKKTKRAAEVISEMAIEEAQKIKKVFVDGIDEDQPIGVRLQAAKEIIKIETEQEELALRQRAQEFDEMSKGELADEIIALFGQLRQAGSISGEVLAALEEDGVVDADVIG